MVYKHLSPNTDLILGAECAPGAASANAAAPAGQDGGAAGSRSCGPAGTIADAEKDNAKNFAKKSTWYNNWCNHMYWIDMLHINFQQSKNSLL